MIVSCPSCSTRYKLDPTKFGPAGRRVRCTKCAHVWTQLPPEDLPLVLAEAAPATAATDTAGPEMGAAANPDSDSESGPRIMASPEIMAARAAARARAAEAAQRRAGGGNRAGWVVLVLVVVAVAAGAVLAREAVVRAWPPAERLYTLLGVEALRPGAGLAIKVIEHRRDIAGTTPVLFVRGEVTNTTEAVRDVPRLRASLRNARGNEVGNWTFAAAQARLLPGETTPFATRRENPNKDGTILNIDFVAGGR